MKTTLTVLGLLGLTALTVACSSAAEDSGETTDEISVAAESCGSPESLKPLVVGAYILKASATGSGKVLMSLDLGSDGRYAAIDGGGSPTGAAPTKGSTSRGSYRIESPRCPTSDRLLILTPSSGAALTFTVKPESTPGVFTFTGDGFNKFSLVTNPDAGVVTAPTEAGVTPVPSADCRNGHDEDCLPRRGGVCGSICSNNVCIDGPLNEDGLCAPRPWPS